jgi:CHRD domain/PEP-CTERM motif
MKLRLLVLLAGLLTCALTSAATLRWNGALAPEVANATGTGTVALAFNTSTRMMFFDVRWSGLSGTSTVAHIHCCTALANTGFAGIAVDTPTLDNFPTGLSAGSYDGIIDLSLPINWGAAFINANGGSIDAALPVFLSALDDGRAYFNLHSTRFPGGEIRGFTQRSVPEPSTLLLGGIALAGFAARRRLV